MLLGAWCSTPSIFVHRVSRSVLERVGIGLVDREAVGALARDQARDTWDNTQTMRERCLLHVSTVRTGNARNKPDEFLPSQHAHLKKVVALAAWCVVLVFKCHEAVSHTWALQHGDIVYPIGITKELSRQRFAFFCLLSTIANNADR